MKSVFMPLRVLVVWELGTHLGHLLRLLPVVTELIGKGHEVLLAVPDPAFAHKFLHDSQVKCVRCPTTRSRPGGEQQEGDVVCYADILSRYAFGDEAGLAEALKLWASLIGEFKPDVLLIEFAPLAMLAARLHQLPAVHLAIGWEAPPQSGTLPIIRASAMADETSVFEREAALVRRINKHCASAGVAELQWLSDLYKSATQLIATLPETDHFGPRLQGRYVGPLFSTEFGPVVRWPEPSAEQATRRVFMYLQPDRANLALLKALNSLGADVIAVLPELQAEAAECMSNDRIQLYSHPVRLAGLLEKADFVITNAGHGLVAASLLAGTPLLLIPRNVEQAMLAKRIKSTGAAHVLPREHVAVRAHEAIERLVNDAYAREAAKTIARKYVACTEDGVIAKVVDAIETVFFETSKDCCRKNRSTVRMTPKTVSYFSNLWSMQ